MSSSQQPPTNRPPPSSSHDVDDAPTDEESDERIDPNLQLRTTRTAASVIAESIAVEQNIERRKTRRKARHFFRKHREEKQQPPSAGATPTAGSGTVPGKRRNVYVNWQPFASELDSNGEPIVRYERNKVRTTKYTIITFIPKNLYEQFRRVANLFFLTLVILQLFPIFGAAAGSVAALPLAFILTVTAIKDGVEDYRRGTLDEEVNTSAATKLGGGWLNVNQPKDSRSWFEKLLGINQPGKVSKGVKKLREREKSEMNKIMLTRNDDSRDLGDSMRGVGGSMSMSMDTDEMGGKFMGAGGRRLEDIQSIDSHSYPPGGSFADLSKASFSESMTVSGMPSNFKGSSDWGAPGASVQSFGVVDYKRPPHTSGGGSAQWERTLWKKLEVGDIVLLRDNEQVPADIVVLSTSDPDGMCYLETKNLDGETNLKPRKAVKATSSICSEEDVLRSSFYLDSEPPHQNLYLYHGVLRYKDPSTGQEKQEPVSINELLLRGCAIRNTAWIIGLVVFTGADTKIMLNGGDTPSKRSKIEKETNFNVIVNFGVLTLMCLVAAICNGVQDARTGTSAELFEEGSDPSSSHIINAVITFVSCLIAFQNMVPISLYISIEIVKTIQAYFISQDIDMYYRPYDTACVPKTWNISDDLGQIEYVFSDKTGTLTQNIMEFQKCSIRGVAYGEGITEAQRGAAMREGRIGGANANPNDLASLDPQTVNEKLGRMKDTMISLMQKAFKNRWRQDDKLTLVSPKLAEDLADRNGEQRAHLIAFFRALALCHTVLAEKVEIEEGKGRSVESGNLKLEYKAESPDEAALVAAARDAGFPFINKSKDYIDIEVLGQAERYTPLRVLEFNSTRKRMSVILRCPDGRLVLYCKGADSVIYARLEREHDPWLKEQTAKDMESFANGGLRTLCIAYRYLEEDEYLSWSQEYEKAINSIDNRDEEIEKANEAIEKNLKILGATALEDKLQQGVPDAIEMLHKAGIKLWILTGDKVQTAIEIGYSCNLLKNDMDIMILSADSPEATRNQIEAGLNKIASVHHENRKTHRTSFFGGSHKTDNMAPPITVTNADGSSPVKAQFAVVIDGDTLRHALSTQELKNLFLNLGTQCETVVCCRVSPAQKALTVKLVKEGRDAMTLSIGDGANDVAMIQEANIGCGLLGLEGSQAAMSADYAFGQFKFLTKLLLVHGRWSYQRIAEMHSNFFYKNVIWTFAMFWYLPFNSFDGTYLYHFTFIMLINLVFTSLPVIVLGAFDQDLSARAALAFPQLYVRGIKGLEYTRTKFWLYMLDGLYQSAVVFFIPFGIWMLGLNNSWNGKTIDSLADFGTTVAIAAIFAANTYVGMNTRYWTVITWIIIPGSSIVALLWVVIYSFFFSSDFIDEVVILYGNVTFWATVLMSVVIALAPRFFVKFWTAVYTPLDKDIIREKWVKGDLKDQLGIPHRRDVKKAKRKGSQAPFLNKELERGPEMALEARPMFHEMHSRSLSELSTTGGGNNGQYELALTSSPGMAAKSGKELRDTALDETAIEVLAPTPTSSTNRFGEKDLTSSPHPPSSPNRNPYFQQSTPPSQYPYSDSSSSSPPRQSPRSPPTSSSSPFQGLGLGRGNTNMDPGSYELREVRTPPNDQNQNQQQQYAQQQHLGALSPSQIPDSQRTSMVSGHHGERSASGASFVTASEGSAYSDDEDAYAYGGIADDRRVSQMSQATERPRNSVDGSDAATLRGAGGSGKRNSGFGAYAV
ncbi:hypothetical protein AX16_006309 [Volvariella volvacea WC 439]|nr:hypothetical protein AX16_006309 [Volvariella volvacea WC 439]